MSYAVANSSQSISNVKKANKKFNSVAITNTWHILVVLAFECPKISKNCVISYSQILFYTKKNAPNSKHSEIGES